VIQFLFHLTGFITNGKQMKKIFRKWFPPFLMLVLRCGFLDNCSRQGQGFAFTDLGSCP